MTNVMVIRRVNESYSSFQADFQWMRRVWARMQFADQSFSAHRSVKIRTDIIKYHLHTCRTPSTDPGWAIQCALRVVSPMSRVCYDCDLERPIRIFEMPLGILLVERSMDPG